jgi:type IV secretory pathway TrbF-like protein
MPKKDDQERMLPERDFALRALGQGHWRLRMVYGMAFILLLANVAQGVERWYYARTTESKVFVVVSDPNGNVTQIARAMGEWQPEDGVWVNAAQTWLRNIRALPEDEVTWKWQAEQIKATTNRDLWFTVNDWVNRARKEFRKRAVDFEILETTRQGSPRKDAAIVYLRWRERARGLSGFAGDWTCFAASVTLQKKPPQDAKEVQANALGIVAVDYSYQGNYACEGDQKRADLR